MHEASGEGETNVSRSHRKIDLFRLLILSFFHPQFPTVCRCSLQPAGIDSGPRMVSSDDPYYYSVESVRWRPAEVSGCNDLPTDLVGLLLLSVHSSTNSTSSSTSSTGNLGCFSSYLDFTHAYSHLRLRTICSFLDIRSSSRRASELSLLTNHKHTYFYTFLNP